MPAESTALAELARRTDGPTLDQIWTALSTEERHAALKAYLASDKANRASLFAVAASLPALRAFRKQTVAQMQDGKIIDLIARANKLTPGILHDVLLALHLTARKAMLASFLDLLAIPHKDAVIEDGASVAGAAKGEKLAKAVAKLRTEYPPRDVSVYLLTLLAMDPESWGAVREIVAGSAG